MSATEEDSASLCEPSAEEMPPESRELARDMFEKITEYLNGELAG